MSRLSVESIWQMNERELLAILESQPFAARRKRLCFYAPSFMYYRTSHHHSSSSEFPSISITGKGCALKCKHCGGIVLNTMYPANTPERLFELCIHLKEEGAKGCLISGGCLPSGAVPVERFVDAIAKVKHELGLTVFVHTGVVNLQTAKALKKAGVDAALIDVIGSDETIEEIYKLDATVNDYEDSLRALHETEIDFVPHVIVGLHYGALRGERHALEMISRYRPSAVVIIAFMPIRGTEMERVKPPKPIDIARVTAAARLMFTETPLVLGCMRSRDKHRSETEILATKAGVDAIAFPTEEAVEFARRHGYTTSFSSSCCSQIYLDMKT